MQGHQQVTAFDRRTLERSAQARHPAPPKHTNFSRNNTAGHSRSPLKSTNYQTSVNKNSLQNIAAVSIERSLFNGACACVRLCVYVLWMRVNGARARAGKTHRKSACSAFGCTCKQHEREREQVHCGWTRMRFHGNSIKICDQITDTVGSKRPNCFKREVSSVTIPLSQPLLFYSFSKIN